MILSNSYGLGLVPTYGVEKFVESQCKVKVQVGYWATKNGMMV
jgi:hypothetical protein